METRSRRSCSRKIVQVLLLIKQYICHRTSHLFSVHTNCRHRISPLLGALLLEIWAKQEEFSVSQLWRPWVGTLQRGDNSRKTARLSRQLLVDPQDNACCWGLSLSVLVAERRRGGTDALRSH
uniref:Uncharacterized protein n=1 Tax=Rousettus aegyptiacus TaxID=9407 RepID=A0A7J8F105_ROUAE|nr:hypothetical protein HJG63_012430 [Rousettus aegyptiacus]